MADRQDVRERLALEAQVFTHLAKHEAWPVLKQVIDEKIQRDITMLEKGTDKVDLRTFDYTRGVWAGMKYVIGVVEKGEQNYQRALDRAENMEGVA